MKIKYRAIYDSRYNTYTLQVRKRFLIFSWWSTERKEPTGHPDDVLPQNALQFKDLQEVLKYIEDNFYEQVV